MSDIIKNCTSITTTDLAEFGDRELEEVVNLVNAKMRSGLPEDFEDTKVTVMFDRYSGDVFFTNEENQVCMCDENGDLFSFYTTPQEGRQGFIFDLADKFYDLHVVDQLYVMEIRNKFYRDVKLNYGTEGWK
tara:strand:+ start:1100 stop:1495 length:396 start_codon:yes stop_codon:yes gene_type:complete